MASLVPISIHGSPEVVGRGWWKDREHGGHDINCGYDLAHITSGGRSSKGSPRESMNLQANGTEVRS